MAYAPNYFETPEQRAQRMRNSALGGQDLFDVEGPMPGDWRQQIRAPGPSGPLARDFLNERGGLPPPFMETKQEVASRLAGQRTDKWRRRLYGLAAGLQAARGASNFGEGLLGGLSGSLMGGEQFQRHQDEQEQVRLKGEQEKADREYRMLQDAINNKQQDERIRMERQRLYAEKGPSTLEQEIAALEAAGKTPEEARLLAVLGRDRAEGGAQTSATERVNEEEVRAYLQEKGLPDTPENRLKAVFDIRVDRQRLDTTESPITDYVGPWYIGPDGKPTRSAVDVRTGQFNRPATYQRGRGYGTRFGGQPAPVSPHQQQEVDPRLGF